MKILSPKQTKAADQYTIDHEPIASIDLMERAALAFTEAFTKTFPAQTQVDVFCGTGNNGGDGLAIARMLLEKDCQVATYVVRINDRQSNDFGINYERLSRLMDIHTIADVEDIPKVNRESIVIDAIFGSGLDRPVTGLFAQVIDKMNRSETTLVSVDIASGLSADQPNPNEGAVVEADYTFSFQLPKLAFLLPQNEPLVGEWKVLDIGLDQNFIHQQIANYQLLQLEDAKSLLQARKKFSHKGTFGHALLLAGSKGKMGAAILAARACIRSGVGLLTAQIPACGYEIMQTAVPEAMVLTDPHPDHLSNQVSWPDFTVLGMGPGLGRHPDTAKFFHQCLQQASGAMIIDADGLNIMSEHRDWLTLLPENSILTPHPKEFTRLTKDYANDYDRLMGLSAFSKKNKVITVLKGANSAICDSNGQIFFNSTGNPGMATAGSGDVLTGILLGLLAQGYEPLSTAQLGVYLHGLAGDLAASDLGEEALIASDIIDYIGAAFGQLKE